MEEFAVRESGTQSVAPSWATPSPPWEKPQEDQLEDWPNKFQPGASWTKVSRTDGNSQDSATYRTPAEYDCLHKELGKERVMKVLRDYLAEQDEAMETLVW